MTAIMLAVAALASRFAQAQCGTWTPPLNISNSTGRFAVDSHLAIDANGNVHLIYQDFLDSNGVNYYTTNMGGSWSPRVNLGGMNGKGSAPKIIITPDQQLHALFGRGTLYWRTKPVSGGAWSAAQQVSVASDSYTQGVTMDSSGGIYFLHGNLFDNSAPARNGIYGNYKPLGGAWQGAELIYGNSDDNNWPRGDHIMADGTTLWVSIGIDGDMHYKLKTAGGAWPAGKGTLFNEEGGGLRFASDPNSNEVVALWANDLPCEGECEDDPWFESYAKYTTNNGASWSGTFNISNMVNDIDRTPTGAYDANGNLHIVWEGFCCDHKLRMRYRGRVGGVWGPIQQFSSMVGGYIPDSLVANGLDLHFTYSNNGTGIGLIDVVYTTLNGSLPRINLSKSSINHTIYIGNSLPDETFTVSNGCAGELNYTITDNAAWLGVAPDSGSSTVDVDTITISYDVAGLHRGVYNATITGSGNAFNNPQSIAVKVTVNSVKPDFDGDGDADQADFGHFQQCITGSAVPQSLPACQDARLDADDDVDANDFAIFQGCMSGAGIIAVQNCMP